MEQISLPIKTKIAAWWMIVIGVIMILPTLFFLCWFFFGLSAAGSPGDIGTLLFALFEFLICLGFFVFGTSILKRKKWAWLGAILVIIISCISPVCQLFVSGIIFGTLDVLFYPSFFLGSPVIFFFLLFDRKNFWKATS